MHVVKELKNYGFTSVSIIRKDGSFYIKKELISDNPYYEKLFKNEIAVMKVLNHKNIVSLIEVDKEEKFFLLGYCELGDLKEYMNKNKLKFLKKRDYFTLKIMEGIEYIHSLNLVHNDLKLSNIFLAKSGKLKIGDFGLSAYENSDFFSDFPPYIFKGTYSLNRKSNNDKISKKDDIYALGVIIFELYSFKDPAFNDLNKNLIEDDYIKNLFSDLISDSSLSISDIITDFKKHKKNIF